MPLLEITTNTTVNNSLNFAKKSSELVSEMLGKPESYVMIKIQDQQILMFSGNNEPTAYLKLKSLGLPEDKTEEFSLALCNFIQTELNIDTTRIYIEFSNPQRHMWGWNNRTF